MTRTIVALLALCLILAGLWLFLPKSQNSLAQMEHASREEVWHDFTPSQGQFRIKLPSLPHHATETVEDASTHEKRLYDFFLASKDDGTIYAVNTINFPKKSQENPYNEDFLRNFIQQMLLSNPVNKVKTMEVKPFRSIKALDFKVENAEVTIDGKAFFDDNTLYILSTTARNEHQNGPEFSTFIDSFQILPKEK
jgi:hypothetical protein